MDRIIKAVEDDDVDYIIDYYTNNPAGNDSAELVIACVDYNNMPILEKLYDSFLVYDWNTISQVWPERYVDIIDAAINHEPLLPATVGSILLYSSVIDDIATMKKIINRGFKIQDNDDMLLTNAICHQHLDSVKFLISCGVDTTYSYNLPLTVAMYNGLHDIARELIKTGAWITTLHPYDYLDILNDSHIPHLGEYPDIIRAITSRRRNYIGYEDVIIVTKST